MNTLKVLSLFLILSLGMVSCGKDEEPVDSTPPVITITAPAEGSVLIKGNTYPIVGTVTDNEELVEIDGGSFKITTFDSKTSHVLTNISLPIDANAPSGGATFTVSATDKAGNKSTKAVNFTIQ